MTEETRRAVVRLAIAADLVIVATGIALFVEPEPVILLALYVGAVTIAAAKGGWRGGAIAVLMSTAALLGLFGSAFDQSHLIAFIVDGAIASAIMEATFPRKQTRRTIVPQAAEYGKLVAVPSLDPEERERESVKRHEIARTLERAAAAQLSAQRESERAAAVGASVTPLDPNRGKRNDRSKRG